MSSFSPKHCPKTYLYNTRHKSSPWCVGFQKDRSLVLGRLFYHGVLCSFMYLAPEAPGAGHCWTQDAGRTRTLDRSVNALPMNSFAGDLRDYFKL